MRGFGIGVVVAVVLAFPAGASARSVGQVLVRTPTQITQMSLDRSGRAAWIQLNANTTCYRIHRGDLLHHQNHTITTTCYQARGPTSISGEAGPIVASARTADSPLHIAWADQIQTYDETLTKVLVPNGRGGRWRIAYIYVDCGGETCSAAGRILGPMASKDGVVLYAVDNVVPPANCDPSTRSACPS